MGSLGMNIGEAAEAAGVSAKMMRHYEEIGLLGRVPRSANGYRSYSEQEVGIARFIRRARGLGFSTQQIAELIGLWRDQRRPSRKVKELAQAHIAALEERIRELHAMKKALSSLAAHCHGDEHPECAILDALASFGARA